MKIFIIFNLSYLTLITVHNNIRDQLLEKIQKKLYSGDYACLNLDDHYIIHWIKLSQTEINIVRFDKIRGVTDSDSINIQENSSFEDTLKQSIIQILYSYKDIGLKYLCITTMDVLIKNKSLIFNFWKNLSSYISMIENYDESKRDYLKYETVLRNSNIFSYYTYNKRSPNIQHYYENFNKKYFDFALRGNKSQLYFFTINFDSLDMSEYFRFYYTHFRKILEEDIDTLLRFVKNINFELHEIESLFQTVKVASLIFYSNRRSMGIENIPITRKIDLEINENQMIWNSICFSPTKESKFDETFKYFAISHQQLVEIKKFNSEINEICLEDLKMKNKIMHLLNGSELYRKILNIVLINKDSGKSLILINILYSLSIITRFQFEEYLYNRNTNIIDINDIINQINYHWKSVSFSLYNILLYSELENIAIPKKIEERFFKEFNQVMSISSVRKLMDLSNIDHLPILKKLHVFVNKVYYNPDFGTLEFNLEHSNEILLYVCKMLSCRLIIDDNLGLSNTKDYFEQDYIQMIYDKNIMKQYNN